MMESTPARSPAGGNRPLLQHLRAPAHWRQIDFISDLHLHAGDAPTFAAWQHYLQHTTAQAVFMLGDLFEAWVGDDVLSNTDTNGDNAFALSCARVLHQAGARLDLFFICGNRDFLVGPQCLQACAMQGLADPCVLELGATRWLLSHGDALCLDDTAYQQFRAQVRSPAWQSAFLAQPLAERQSVARELRTRSEQHKRAHPVLVDVDAPAARQWLRDADADVLIHGHTHQPADHVLSDTMRRMVLSDWDLQATPARAEVLRVWLAPSGEPAQCRRLAPAHAC
ncbi:UDP-2,3-diacylglucosamine diphosphatase [Comamonadaceae bacterium G21597-S1]|nr:UDP-2,3-diacylglucosamine diphosphatase [Comamonadaceae bacterium G21597-S1]